MKLGTGVFFAALLASIISVPALAHGTEGPASPAKKWATPAEQKPFGIEGDPALVDRTIQIRMTDQMRFEPSVITVKAGETIRFVHRNVGKVMHEMVIGTRAELEEHAALMRKFPGMEHDEPHMAHVAPGKRGEMVWLFNRAGEFEFACLIPGHFESGMRGTIKVAAKGAAPLKSSQWSSPMQLVQSGGATASPMTEAEVRKVDKGAAKITLRHGEIKHLEMPAMTMVFQVKDKAMLDKVKAGDKVRFAADKVGGAYTIMQIEPAR